MLPSIKAIAALFSLVLGGLYINFELLSLANESYDVVRPPPIDLSMLLKSTNS